MSIKTDCQVQELKGMCCETILLTSPYSAPALFYAYTSFFGIGLVRATIVAQILRTTGHTGNSASWHFLWLGCICCILTTCNRQMIGGSCWSITRVMQICMVSIQLAKTCAKDHAYKRTDSVSNKRETERKFTCDWQFMHNCSMLRYEVTRRSAKTVLKGNRHQAEINHYTAKH